MALDKKRLALIHVGKKRLALDEDSYREILHYVGGVESARDLDAFGFNAVMEHFERLGFVSDFAKANMGHRMGMASPGQVALIRNLWRQFTDDKGDDVSLGKWLEGKFKVSALRFVDDHVASKAIAALRNMLVRKAAKG